MPVHSLPVHSLPVHSPPVHPAALHSGVRRLRSCVAVAVGAATLLVVTAAAASAHVTVSSPDAAPGGFGKLVFRVPSEAPRARTTQIRVTLPLRTPFAFASTKPHPGWTARTTERTLDEPVTVGGFRLTRAVATVTWTATPGHALRPGQFDEFELSVGPFPRRSGTVAMPVLQRFSDGSRVFWDQRTKAGAPEPEHPAPTLELPAAATATPSAGIGGTGDPLARWLSGAALVVAGPALVLGLARRRRW